MDAYSNVLSICVVSDAQDFHNIRREYELEFKKSLRIPDTIHYKTSRRSSLFRSSNSLGSLGMFSSTQSKKSPGITSAKEKLSKSEDTLDSMKHSISESEDEIESDSEENASSTDDKISPDVRKFKK